MPDEQDDYQDQTKRPTIARLGRFSAQLPSASAAPDLWRYRSKWPICCGIGPSPTSRPGLSRWRGRLELPAFAATTQERGLVGEVVPLPGGPVTLQAAVDAFPEHRDLAPSTGGSIGPRSPAWWPSSAQQCGGANSRPAPCVTSVQRLCARRVRARVRARRRGSGVRARRVAASTTWTAASASVCQAAWTATGLAPTRVRTQQPTTSLSNSSGAVAPRWSAGQAPWATSGRVVTPAARSPAGRHPAARRAPGRGGLQPGHLP
jgi:hypothetical protein